VPEATIRLLGGFSAAVGAEDVPESAWRLKKGRELVKLLALAPRQLLHAEQAMDVLWRELEPAAAANNLHQAVHVARRALGHDTIQRQGELLELNAEVDVARFERAALDARRAGTPAAYRAALSLYGGELLPENRYDDWAQEPRDALAQLRKALAAELAGLGAVEGLRPLPAEASSFVGRRRELRELRTSLSHTRLLTLTGAGGSGKTRLAVELAGSEESAYSDGAVFVELAPVEDADLVVQSCAAALDVRALPGRALGDTVVDFVASRSLLLVLDNCEHVLVAAAELVRRLLRGAPQLRILATSREPLRVPGETVFVVPSLTSPDPDVPQPPSELRRYEGVRLFVERAAAAAPGFDLDPANADAVARICFRLDGLPLALELAAARLGALTPAAIAERLDDRFRLLRAGNRAAPTRQQTLEATLAWSYELLAPDERILFRRLAAFSGSFDLEAAEAVCAGERLPAEEVADVLARLVEKSLVMTADRGTDRRYRLLETVRMYANRLLEDSGETAAVACRLVDWALLLAERERGSPRLDMDAPNFRRVLDLLMGDDPEAALRLSVALWPFWLRRIDLDEGLRRFDDVLAAVSERTGLRAEALLASVALALRAGKLGREYTSSLESLAISEEVGDALLQWRSLHILGGAAVSHDDGRTAVAWFERARNLARAEALAAAEASCIHSLGIAHWRLNDHARAEEMIVESVAAFAELAGSTETIPAPLSITEVRSLGRRPIVVEDTLQPFVEVTCASAYGYAVANHAGIRRECGDLARARQLLDKALRHFASHGDERGQADVLLRLGHLEVAEGVPAEARTHLERALDLRRRMNDRRGVGMALSGLGRVETAAGEFTRAEQQLAEARELFRRAGDRWGLTSALWNTADLAVAQGGLDAAEEVLEEALALQTGKGRDRWHGETLARLAELNLTRNDGQRAAALFTEAHERFVSGHDEAGAAEIERRLRAVAKRTQEIAGQN
jgi:predicted ATPase